MKFYLCMVKEKEVRMHFKSHNAPRKTETTQAASQSAAGKQT